MSAVNFDSVPIEVFVSHVVPLLKEPELAALSKVNRVLRFHVLPRRLFQLWPLYNNKFLNDAAFREEVTSVLPRNRLVLTGSRVKDVTPFEGVHTAILDSPECTDLRPLAGVHTLKTKGGPIKKGETQLDFSALGNVQVFHIEACGRLNMSLLKGADTVHYHGKGATFSQSSWNVRYLQIDETQAATLPPLPQIHTIELDGNSLPDLSFISSSPTCKVLRLLSKWAPLPADLSFVSRLHTVVLTHPKFSVAPAALGNIHTLELRYAKDLEDVSALGNHHSLFISGCGELSVVGNLCRVHSLTLESCSRYCEPGDISKLGKVHTLILDYSNVGDVSQLGGVHSLSLDHCDITAGVRNLGTVHTLNLNRLGHQHDDDVQYLGGVHHLRLSKSSVTDVSALSNVHTLILDDCEGVVDVSSLGNVHTLSLRYCSVVDVSALCNVHALDLTGTKVTDISALTHVHTLSAGTRSIAGRAPLLYCHTLDLTGCSICDVSLLGSVHTLSLRGCKLVRDVSMLGNVHSLSLRGNSGLDVGSLGAVHTLDLSYCAGLQNLSKLARVCILDISNFRGLSQADVDLLARSVRKLTC